jgi:hypothetical protein
MNYKRIYEELIIKYGSKIKPEDIYTEQHHIIPKCLGGEDTPENLVYLSARCHLLAHWLLVRIMPDNYNITHAFAMMCFMKNSKMDRKVPPLHILSEARERKAKAQSKKLKGTKIEFNSEESNRKRIETAIKNGSYRGLNNGKAQAVDVYNYFSGELVASNVSVTEWGRNNDVKRNLNATLYSDRSKLSSSTNRYHAKGFYIVLHGTKPYPPAGGTYAGPYKNQGHIGRKKKRIKYES